MIGAATDDRDVLEHAVQRQLALVTKHDGRGATFQANWRFATGLGLPHPVENGLAWHHTLGAPYLAGSAVKGLVRAWVEVWNDSLGEAQSEQRQQRLDTWFGSLEQAGTFLYLRRPADRTGPFSLNHTVADECVNLVG